MKLVPTSILAAALLAFVAASAWASGPPATTPGATHVKAYGVYCKAELKTHVAGQKGTPFSQCVTAMAKLNKGATSSPQTACKLESKKHVTGHAGTPFSLCVSGGAKLLTDKATTS